MKLDKIDYKILWHLHYNARMPASLLAKKVGISKQGISYRLKKLINEKVITTFTSVIDIHKLGYSTYRVYIRYKEVNNEKEKEIINLLKEHTQVLWLVSLSGEWDAEIVFTARNAIHFNNIWKKIREEIGTHIAKYNISMSIVNYHLDRNYLIGKPHNKITNNYYGFEPTKEKIDKLDIKILKELTENCRLTSQEIGEKVGVNYHTVQSHIKKLEENKIIASHRITINLDKINRLYYKAAITLNNINKEQEESIYLFCSKYNFIVYLVEVLGAWQLEIETEVLNEREFTNFVRDLRNAFPELIADYIILEVTKEHKLNYMPMGIEV